MISSITTSFAHSKSVELKTLQLSNPKGRDDRIKSFATKIIEKAPKSSELFLKFKEIAKELAPDITKDELNKLLEEAKNQAENGAYVLSDLKKTSSLTPKEIIEKIKETAIHLLEVFLEAFGLGDLFEKAKTKEEALHKQWQFMKLSSLFTLLASVFSIFLAPARVAMATGSTLLGIAGLSFIYPKIKVDPADLQDAENLTPQKDLPAASGRISTLNAIADILETRGRPLLLGKSGVGKTTTIKAFARAVKEGKYPKLIGKKVFRINMGKVVASFDPMSGQNIYLDELKKRVNASCILVFDEIHMIAHPKYEALCNQFKDYLDPQGFPFVIGVTTEEEYFRDIAGKHKALARRFTNLSLKNTTYKQTVAILEQYMRKVAPEIVLEDYIIEYLLYKTQITFGKDAYQPGTAITMLEEAIQKLNSHNIQQKELLAKFEEERDQIRSKKASYKVQKSDDLTKKLKILNLNIETLREKIESENQKLNVKKLSSKYYLEGKKEYYKTAQKVSSIAAKTLSSKDKEDLAYLKVLYENILPNLEKNALTLDQNVINSVIESEKKRRAEDKKGIARGKKLSNKNL